MRALCQDSVGIGDRLFESGASQMEIGPKQPDATHAGFEFQGTVEVFLGFFKLVELHVSARLDPKDVGVVGLLLDGHRGIAQCGLRVTIVHQHVCARRQQVRVIRSDQQSRVHVALDVVCQHQCARDSHAKNQRIDMTAIDPQRDVGRLIGLLDPTQCNQRDGASNEPAPAPRQAVFPTPAEGRRHPGPAA
jgi:hypothetical protein